MKKNQYAITSISIYDQTLDLVSKATREPVYQKIPHKSFAESMYKVCQKYIDFKKMHKQQNNNKQVESGQ